MNSYDSFVAQKRRAEHVKTYKMRATISVDCLSKHHGQNIGNKKMTHATRIMRPVYISTEQLSIDPLQPNLPPVPLHPDPLSTTPQKTRRSNPRRAPKTPREPWPGSSLGIRAPRLGETPLSLPEVIFAARHSLI
jgi:hypothetical protein